MKLLCRLVGHSWHRMPGRRSCMRCHHTESLEVEQHHEDPDASRGEIRYSIDDARILHSEVYLMVDYTDDEEWFEWIDYKVLARSDMNIRNLYRVLREDEQLQEQVDQWD